MDHINSLSDYLLFSLSYEERAYLVTQLNASLVHIDSATQQSGFYPTVADDLKSEHEFSLKNEFQTLNKRTVKYAVLKNKLIIQKPKTLHKLNNTINQISGSGGLLESVVLEIVSQLEFEKIIFVADDVVTWLK